MTRVPLVALILILLAGIVAAEPQPVDGGWQRSDEAPEATPTAPPPEGMPAPTAPPPKEMPAPTAAPPENATEPEAAAGTAWLLYGAVGACGLFALIMLWRWIGEAKR